MRNEIRLQELSVLELRELIQCVIRQETEKLREEVTMLREELRANRPVLTARAAVFFFDHYVSPATIIEYINYCGLPAEKRGRLWFIYRKDLFDWQIGRIGHESTKHLGIRNVVAPRHGLLSKPERESISRRSSRTELPQRENSSGSNISTNKNAI